MLSLPDALREPSLAGLIGAFVLGTGLSYFSTGSPPQNEVGAARWKAVWTVTALIRMCVAVYLFAGVAIGRMQPGWLTVAASDAAMAALQIAAMWAGWLATCVCDRETPL